MKKQCPGCGNHSVHFHDHHIVPRALGGLDQPSNIIEICVDCHGKIHSRKFLNHSELTKTALQHKKANGQRVGNIPFGLNVADDGKMLIKNETEQATLTKLLELRQKGLTLRDIATELNRLGFKTRKGGQWKHQYVASLIKATLLYDITPLRYPVYDQTYPPAPNRS